MSERRFDGQCVLITGGTGALGGAITRAFLQEGARVAVTYIFDHEVAPLTERVGDLAAHLTFHKTDVTDETSVNATVTEILSDFGQVDAAANIAGGYTGGVPVAELPTATWNTMHDLNLRSAFNVCRAVLPQMKARKRGKIVNVSARAGLSGIAGLSAYSVSKAGVRILTEAIAAEVMDDGINVNCIMPSVIDTPANRKAMPEADASRWVPPEQIAKVVLFLCSDAAVCINGAAIPVYGRA